MKPTSGTNEYLKSTVLTASPEQLQLMLYDGAIRFMLKGLDAIRGEDREASFHALDRAQSIVLELNNGLRREVNPELVDQMSALHMFVYRRLVTANLDHDLVALDEALRILREQRDTWLIVIQKVNEARATLAGSTSVPRPPAPASSPAAGPGSRFQPGDAAAGEATGFVAEA